MAVWVKLQNLLAEGESDAIPENTGSKIEDHLLHLHQLIGDLKNENAELTAISERQQFQFEKEIFDSENQLKESTETSIKLKTAVSELEKNLNSAQTELRELRQAHESVNLELQSLKRSDELLSQERKQLVDQLEKRRNDIDKLNADLKCLIDQVSSANQEKHAAFAKAEEAQMQESKFQHQVNRLDQEKSLLEKQINDLNVELAQKNHEIHVLRREKSSIGLELQSHLEHRVDEVHLLEKQVAVLKEASEDKDRKIEGLAEKIRTLNDNSRQTEEQYSLELAAQTKLVDLFKKASEDNQNRVKELVSAFEQAQKLLQELSEARTEAEKCSEAVETRYKTKIQEIEQVNTKLKDELKHANDLCQGKVFSSENLEELFPTAAATSKVLRSGMTLTQLYSEFVKAQEEIQNLNDENGRLKEQLKQIITEIEENTPVVNQKMKEYHKCLETISCLRTQLASSLTDYEKLLSERNDAKRISGQMERENKRLKLQLQDLNKQIQELLREIEERRGSFGKIGRLSDRNVLSSDDITNAGDVISSRLVTFRNIVELQTKNQELLAVVRQLSEDHEEQEKKAADEKTAELQKELQSALSQLEELQKNRIKQSEHVQSIVRQRDMYRVLLTNQGFSESLLGSPQGPSFASMSHSSLSPSLDMSSTKTAFQQLQTEFDNYKKEKAENERLLNQQVDKTRNEVSDLRVDQAKLTSHLEYSEERVNILKTNMENLKKEAAFLREKNQKYSSLVTQHQQTIQNMQHELMDSHEKLAKATVTLENVRSERDLLKNTEKRLMHEKELHFREQQQKSQVLANLQAIQNNFERIESETKRSLQGQVDKFEKENAMLKAKLENANEDYRSAVTVWEKRNKEQQQKIESEIAKNQKIHDELIDSYAKLHAVSQELSNMKASTNSSSECKTDKPITSNLSPKMQPNPELRKLRDQLQETQARVKALQDQLDLARKTSDRYLKMCSDLELHVKEQDQINCQLKESMESSLKNSSEARKALEGNLENMEKSNRSLIEESMKFSQDRENKIQELMQQITSLEKEILNSKNAVEDAQKIATQAREDCLSQQKIMEETQMKYERELVLHADDVKALTVLKEEHQKCEETISRLSSESRNVEESLKDYKSSWSEREELMVKEQEQLRIRVNDLEAQNDNLLNELELLGTQMKAAVLSKKWSDVPTESSPVDLKDTNHLLQIIQFLKKEKEIISTQFDSVQSENIRLKLQLEKCTSDLNEVKHELRELQHSTQVKSVSDAQHAEVLRKVEMMNLLTESNNLMRMEKENLVKEKIELETKLNDLRKQMQPLQDTNKDIGLQLETLSSENLALRQEVKSWQSRTNQLLEQSHRIGPQEYKNLTRELSELKNQKTRLTDELHRKQADFSKVSANLLSVKKEVEILRGETDTRLHDIQRLTAENSEMQKTMLQVKKIGRKYKTQYDELKSSYETASAVAKAQEDVNQDQNNQEMQKKIDEADVIIKGLREELEKMKLAADKKQKEIELLQRQTSEKQEKAHKLLLQARQRIQMLNTQKTTLSKELEDVRQNLNSAKNAAAGVVAGTGSDENMQALKAQYEAKVTNLETELRTARETSEYLKKQCDDLCQKVAQQQKQSSKPSTSSNVSERGSGSSEPLTANIKPLSTPTQASGSGLRHAPHTVTQSPRSTPTASIRPMAIGAACSSQARMATVLPTTAAASVVSTTSDEDGGPQTVLLSTNTVPQAAVQPTPATATVAPTTVAQTITPSSHALVMPEVAHTSSVDSQAVESSPNIIVVAAAAPFPTAHATAMVSPRVESFEVDVVLVEGQASTTSVIVSPPTTQTQLVTPKVKRKLDDSPGSMDGPEGSSATAQKRVRMISEGSQTNQQTTLSTSPHSVNVVPVATVVSRPKMEIPTSEVAPSVHLEEPPTSSSAVLVSSVSTSAAGAENIPEEKIVPVTEEYDNNAEENDDDVIVVDCSDEDWSQVEKAEEEEEEMFDVVVMEEEDDSEQIEGFDEENEQAQVFSSRSGEEDMGDDPAEEVEEISNQAAEFPDADISVRDESSDNQMESESSSLQAPPSSEPCMAPPASPMTQNVEPIETVPEPVITQARRAPQIRRFPGSRHDRLPSTGRQHLAVTIPGQGPSFEEGGDDSIVPSTPTLFVPRRTDGFAEAVSSPVPSVSFLFNSSESSPTQQGLSQLATQGALGVDDTRMDLSQFDEGGSRTVPSTPLQVSPVGETVSSESLEVPVMDQPSEIIVPVIIVESDNSQTVPTADKGDMPQAGSSSEPEIGAISSQNVEAKGDTKTESEECRSSGSKDTETTEGDSSSQGAPSQPIRKPIVWVDENAAQSSTTTIPAPTPSSAPTPAPTGHFPPPAMGGGVGPSHARGTRGRRFKYHGARGNFPRGGGNWRQRPGRGSVR